MDKRFYVLGTGKQRNRGTYSYNVPLIMASSMGACQYTIDIQCEGPNTTVTHTFSCSGGIPRRMRRNDPAYYIAAAYPASMTITLRDGSTDYNIPLRLGYNYPFESNEVIKVNNTYIWAGRINPADPQGAPLYTAPSYDSGPLSGEPIYLPYDNETPDAPLGPWLTIFTMESDILPAFTARHIVRYYGTQYSGSEAEVIM